MIGSLIMTTQTLTREATAARHGFPLPLSGDSHRDITVLLRHAPAADATFNVSFEGELFEVRRHVEGDIAALLATGRQWSDVAVYGYRPAALDLLIGRQEPLAERDDDEPPDASLFLVGPARAGHPAPEHGHLVTFVDTYRWIAGGRS